jgi:hypothetical protein
MNKSGVYFRTQLYGPKLIARKKSPLANPIPSKATLNAVSRKGIKVIKLFVFCPAFRPSLHRFLVMLFTSISGNYLPLLTLDTEHFLYSTLF